MSEERAVETIPVAPPDPAWAPVGMMPTDGSDTSPEAAVSNVNAHSAAQVQFDNARAKAGYVARYVDWSTNMASGQFIPEERRTPPPVPLAEVLGPPNADGYRFPVVGTEPIVINPPLPVPSYNGGIVIDKTPGQFHIGIALPGSNGKIFQGLGDTNVEGTEKTIVGPDGNLLKIRKHNVPWGGHWEVVG